MSSMFRSHRALAITLLLAAGPAIAAETYQLNIPAQPLAKALQSFAQQSGLSLVHYTRVAEARIAPALEGAYTPETALKKLLENSGLEYTYVNPNTVEIREAKGKEGSRKAAPAVHTDITPAAAVVRRIRLAQAEEATSSRAPRAKEKAEGDEVEEVTPTVRGIPEVLVKGSRSLNVDIKRSEDDIQPYVVFEKEQIERSMAGNIEEFFKTRLPMNTVTSTWSQQTNTINGNQSQVDLRGLGTNQTLILVNGRRLPEVSNIVQNGRFTQPDINGIPLSAVERIEVLPSTAGGIYGGGATGGVINIVLKQGYAGVEVRAGYNGAFDGGAARRTADMSAGFSLEGGKTHVLLSGNYSDQDPLLSGDRDFTRRARAKLLANDPASFTSSSIPPMGYTTNIRNRVAGNLVLDDGTPLSSNITHVPVGYGGVATDGGAALVANAGAYDLNLPDTGLGNRRSLISGPRTSAFSANIRRRFGERVEGFIDLSRNENKGRVTTSGSISSWVTLMADAPNNPFTTDVRLTIPFTNAEFESVSKTETLQGLAGVIVRLPYDWFSEVDYSWSRSRLSYIGTNPAFHSDIILALSDGTLDVTRDFNTFPLDYSDYALPSPNAFYGPSDTVLNDVTLRLAGPTVRLPAGPINLSALIEHREQKAEAAFRRGLENAGSNFGEPYYEYYYPRYQTVKSLYLEGLVPLISARNKVPGVRELEMQLSVRRDEYTTKSVPMNVVIYSNSTLPPPEVVYFTNEVASRGDTVGFRYVPVQDLALRASYGTGFLPPAIHQIAPSIFHNITSWSFYDDPKRGNTSIGVITLAQEGNAEAEPEYSKSWSAGAIFLPRVLPGLRLSVDYTRIEKVNELGYLSTPQLLQYEESFPGRIVRGPLTAEDAALGYTAGPITAIYEGSTNFAYTEVEALDMQVDYAWRTESLGSFDIFALFTKQLSFIRQVSLATEAVNTVGFGAKLPWRGNGGLTWNRGPWTAGWNVQYYDSYIMHAPDASPGSISSVLRMQGTVKAPSQMYHDGFAKYRFDDGAIFGSEVLANLEVMIGIQNIFNKIPPIFASTTSSGGASSFGDPRLRSYSLSVRKNW